MPFLMDVWHQIYAVLRASDAVSLLIMLAISLGAGFSIVTATVIALVAFGLTGYVRAITLDGMNPTAFALADWHTFLGLPMRQFLAYALTFAVAISAAHGLRRMVLGRG